MTDRLHLPKGKYARTGYVSPVDATLEIIGGKYKVAILYYIRESVLRFGELRRLMPLATKRMLTKQLRELERDGLIHREVYREIPPKVEYSLTEMGRSLEPLLRFMNQWGRANQASLVAAIESLAHSPIDQGRPVTERGQPDLLTAHP